VTEGSETDSGSKWNRKGSCDIDLRSKLVAGSVSRAAAWRRQTNVNHRDVNMTSRKNKYGLRKTGSETKTKMESIFRNFLRENIMRIIFFLTQN